MQRQAVIEQLGFKVVTMWEGDWDVLVGGTQAV